MMNMNHRAAHGGVSDSRRDRDSSSSSLHEQSSPRTTPSSSGHATPTDTGNASTSVSTSAGSSTYITSSLSSVFGGLMRRLSSDPQQDHRFDHGPRPHATSSTTLPRSQTDGATMHHNGSVSSWGGASSSANGIDGVYTPPATFRSRTASPMRPPPLEPLALLGFRDDTPASARLLTTAVAEEVRIMIPERLRIEDEWKLVYSLDQDGASLTSLYQKCAPFKGRRGGFVLVVRDNEGGIFGAYLSEYPHPSPHYFGTGECFLWRASLMASLPPPPSADTTYLTRSTTIASHSGSRDQGQQQQQRQQLPPLQEPDLLGPPATPPAPMAPPSPASVRFKAFPYSGINEYYAYCEPHYLSVGAGDGKYGLWLDDSLERGKSSRSQTFGNEPLSDEGEKFGILGVEVWVMGARDRAY